MSYYSKSEQYNSNLVLAKMSTITKQLK